MLTVVCMMLDVCFLFGGGGGGRVGVGRRGKEGRGALVGVVLTLWLYLAFLCEFQCRN